MSSSPSNAPLTLLSHGLWFGCIAAAIWASYSVLARYAIIHGLAPADLTFFRFATAAVLMAPLLLRNSGRRAIGGIPWSRALALAVCAGPGFSLLFMGGFKFAPLAHGGVIGPASITVFGMLLAVLMLGETLLLPRLLGLAIVLVGLATLGGEGLLHAGGQIWIGDLMFIAAGALWAMFGILLRRWSIDAIRGTAVVAVISCAIYVPIFLLTADLSRIAHAGFAAISLQVVFQGVLAGVVAVFAFGRTVSLLGAGRAALFPSLVPGLAVILAVPILGEIPTALQISGLLLVSLGLAVALGLVKWPQWSATPT